jgi:periplasmic protein TonB
MNRLLVVLLVGIVGADRHGGASGPRLRRADDSWAGPRPFAASAAPLPFTTPLSSTGADPLAHLPLLANRIGEEPEAAREPASPPPPPPGARPERVEVAPPPPPIEAAETVEAPAPDYPRTARRKGQQGTVTLLAEVRADGSVASCRIETSSGFPLLDQAALAVLPEWRFKQRLVAGSARPFTARVPFRFTIQKD